MPEDDLLTGIVQPARRARPTAPDYNEIIDRHSARTGLDSNLVRAVMGQESGGNPRAVSPKGARGPMQLMPATARRFGVTDSHDPEQAIRGGTDYLKFLSDRYKGNRDLILAGYNAGEGAVDKYGGIPPFRETRNYVRSISQKLGGASTQQPTRQDDDLLSGVVADDLSSGVVEPTVTKPVTQAPKPSPLTTNDTEWHFGEYLPKPSRRALQVLREARAEDDRKRAAGQTEFVRDPAYQAEMRKRAGLKPLPPPPVSQSNIPRVEDILADARGDIRTPTFEEDRVQRIRATSPRNLREVEDASWAQMSRIRGDVARSPRRESARLFDAKATDEQDVLNRIAEENEQKRDEDRRQAEYARNKPEIDRLAKEYRAALKVVAGSGGSVSSDWTSEAVAKGIAPLIQKFAGLGQFAASGGSPGAQYGVDKLRLHAAALEQAAMEQGANRNDASKFAQSMISGFIGTAPELAVMSAGVPAPVVFGAGEGLHAYGKGEPIVPAIVHGAATGAAFEIPGSTALQRIAATGAASTGIELVAGADPLTALASGATNALMRGSGEIGRRGNVSSRTRLNQGTTETNIANEPPRISEAGQARAETNRPVYSKTQQADAINNARQAKTQRQGKLRVAEVADPEAIHYVRKADLRGRGNERMVPLKQETETPSVTEKVAELGREGEVSRIQQKHKSLLAKYMELDAQRDKTHPEKGREERWNLSQEITKTAAELYFAKGGKYFSDFTRNYDNPTNAKEHVGKLFSEKFPELAEKYGAKPPSQAEAVKPETPGVEPVAAETIRPEGLPDDVDLSTLTSAPFIRADHVLKLKDVREHWDANRYEYEVGARPPARVVQDTEYSEFDTQKTRPKVYNRDPDLMDAEGNPSKGWTKLHDVKELSNDATKDPSVMYRGMSGAEMQSVLKSGEIQSNSSMNLGDQVTRRVTSFAADPASARAYAAGFAPWYMEPTFETPSYVIKTKRSTAPKFEANSENYIEHEGGIPLSDISEVWEIRLAKQKLGTEEITVNSSTKQAGRGSASPPFSQYVARKVDLADLKKPSSGKVASLPTRNVARSLTPTPSTTAAKRGELSLPKSLEAAGLPAGSERFYDVKSNIESESKARQAIKDRGIDNASSWVQSGEQPSVEQTATALELIKGLAREAEVETNAEVRAAKLQHAAELSDVMSIRVKEQGQSIQYLYTLAKESPEGALYYGERAARRRNPDVGLAPETRTALFETATKLKSVEAELESVRKQLAEALKSKPTRKRSEISTKITEWADQAEKDARARLAARIGVRGSQAGASTIPSDIADYSIIGAAKLARGTVEFAEWSKQMVSEFGDEVRPYLRQIRTESQKLLDEQSYIARNSKIIDEVARVGMERRAEKQVIEVAQDIAKGKGRTELHRGAKERYGLTQDETMQLLGRAQKLYAESNKGLREASRQRSELRREPDASPEQVKKLVAKRDRLMAERGKSRRELLSMQRRLEQGGPSIGQRLNNTFRGLVVSALQTASRNLGTQTLRTGVESLTDAFELAIVKAKRRRGGKGMEGDIDPNTRMLDTLRSSAYLFQRNKRLVNGILDEFPVEHEAMFKRFASDVEMSQPNPLAKGADKILSGVERSVEIVNVFNRFQEFIGRRAVFRGVLEARLRARGLDLNKTVKEGRQAEIPREDIQAAVDSALRVTFAESPPRGSNSEAFVRFTSSFPAPVNPLTFSRFLWNGAKFTLEYQPTTALRGIYRTARGQPGAARDYAKAAVGTTMLLTATQIYDSMHKEDSEWYLLVNPLTGNEFDARPYQPFASYLFAAHFLRSKQRGEQVSYEPSRMGRAGVYIEGMTGFQARQNPAWEVLKSVTTEDWDGVINQIKRIGGETVAATLTPLKTPKQILAQFDKEEATQRNTRERPFLDPIVNALPVVSRRLKPLTRKEQAVLQPNPILQPLGIREIDPNTKYTRAENYMRSVIQGRYGDDTRTQEEINTSRNVADLRARSRKGEDVSKETAGLTTRQQSSIEASKGQTLVQEWFSKMELSAQNPEVLRAYKLMSRAEQESVRDLLEQKANRALTSLSDADQAVLKEQLEAIGMKQGVRKRPMLEVRERKPQRRNSTSYQFQQ